MAMYKNATEMMTIAEEEQYLEGLRRVFDPTPEEIEEELKYAEADKDLKYWKATEIKFDGKVVGFDVIPENSGWRQAIAENEEKAINHIITSLAYAWEEDHSDDAQPPFGHRKFNWDTIEVKVVYECDAVWPK